MKKFILLSILLLTACIGTTPPSKFYTLNNISSSPQTYPSAKLFIGIGEVSIPQYLDKPQIVVRDSNQVELSVSEFNRWGEPLKDAIQSVLANDLTNYLPASTIKPTSYRQENFDYLIWIEIDRLDGTWKQEASLSAWWTIFNNNSQAIIRQKTEFKIPLGQNYDNLAQQYSLLINQLAQEIALQITKLKK